MSNRKREPRSPYARYRKKPFRYSDTLREISELVRKTGSSTTPRALELREEHAKKFGYSFAIVTEVPE